MFAFVNFSLGPFMSVIYSCIPGMSLSAAQPTGCLRLCVKSEQLGAEEMAQSVRSLLHKNGDHSLHPQNPCQNLGMVHGEMGTGGYR